MAESKSQGDDPKQEGIMLMTLEELISRKSTRETIILRNDPKEGKEKNEWTLWEKDNNILSSEKFLVNKLVFKRVT